MDITDAAVKDGTVFFLHQLYQKTKGTGGEAVCPVFYGWFGWFGWLVWIKKEVFLFVHDLIGLR